MRVVKILVAILLCAGVFFALWQPVGNKVMGSYDSSLEGRTPGQRLNALKAAAALDGVVIAPGKTFSFNKTVGSWSPDRGLCNVRLSVMMVNYW